MKIIILFLYRDRLFVEPLGNLPLQYVIVCLQIGVSLSHCFYDFYVNLGCYAGMRCIPFDVLLCDAFLKIILLRFFAVCIYNRVISDTLLVLFMLLV